MQRRSHIRSLLALTALCAALVVGAATSGAVYTSTSTNRGNAFTAATDWVPPSVSLTNPGTPLRGSVILTAAATDSGSGVASVRLQRSPAGTTTWTDVCTRTAAPYTCSWNTASVTDGRYDLRAVAVDAAGNTATSTIVADRLVDNTAPTPVLVDPGEAIRGTVTLAQASTDTGSGVASVRYEWSPALSGAWTAICTSTAAPFSCAFATATAATPNGDYDLRITVTDAAGNGSTAVIEGVLIDNTAPTVTMTNPGSPLSGVVDLTATAADEDSGIATVAIQRAPAGGTTWTTVCTASVAPYRCRFDTTTVADGLYDVRAVASDVAGNTTTSATIANRRVDNSVSSVSVNDPGDFLRGTVTLTANANSNVGVASVRIQRAPTGKTTWTDICTDTTAPYECTLNTAAGATPDGSYDFRAIMVNGTGATTTSSTVVGRMIDNTPVRGHDIDAINGTGTLGRPDSGDTLLLTYTEAMRPTSLLTGWTGLTPMPVYLRFRDGKLDGGSSSSDVLQFSADPAGLVPTGLGSVALLTDSVKKSKTVVLAGTAVLTSVTVNGVAASRVTITLGAVVSGAGDLSTRTNKTAMVWTPTAAALDLAGNPCSTSPVTESGVLDANF